VGEAEAVDAAKGLAHFDVLLVHNGVGWVERALLARCNVSYQAPVGLVAKELLLG
jgi:hypothetical protein